MKHILAIGPFESSPQGCAPCSCSRPLSQLAAVVLAWSLIGVSSLPAQQPKATAYEVKAAYLYNFGKFVEDANRVRFEVNLTVAERAGLTLSSQLLKVAISARRYSQSGD